jgi:hypothetical protein
LPSSIRLTAGLSPAAQESKGRAEHALKSGLFKTFFWPKPGSSLIPLQPMPYGIAFGRNIWPRSRPNCPVAGPPESMHGESRQLYPIKLYKPAFRGRFTSIRVLMPHEGPRGGRPARPRRRGGGGMAARSRGWGAPRSARLQDPVPRAHSPAGFEAKQGLQ